MELDEEMEHHEIQVIIALMTLIQWFRDRMGINREAQDRLYEMLVLQILILLAVQLHELIEE